MDYESSIRVGRRLLFGDAVPPSIGPPEPTAGLLSTVFGDGMVLRRNTPARIWGRVKVPGSDVTILLDSRQVGIAGSTEDTGVWSFNLPAMVGSSMRHMLRVEDTSDRKSTRTIRNILFGDVFLCLGQSNLVPSKLDDVFSTRDNRTVWELIRVIPILKPYGDARFCEREGAFSRWELPETLSDRKRWIPMENESQRVRASVTCLAFAARVQKHTGVPVGLINAAVGSTFVEQWLPPWYGAFKACGAGRVFQALPVASGGASACFNATVAPFAPMRLSGFVLWLGESNARANSHNLGCLFRRLVTDLRAAFGDPNTYASFVRLSSFCDRRTLALPYVRHS